MFTPPEIVIALLVTMVAATLQGTIGFGFAVLSVPILTFLNPDLTPIPQILLAIPLTIAMATRERSHLNLAGAGWVIGGRVPGAFIGAHLLTHLTGRAIDGLIAFIVLVGALVIGAGWAIRRTRSTKFAAGLASGVFGTTSAVGGPPVALIYHNSPAATMRSTLSTIFIAGLAINIITLTVVGAIKRTDLTTALLLLPALITGFLLSSTLIGRADDRRIRQAVLIVSSFAAIALAIKTVLAA